MVEYRHHQHNEVYYEFYTVCHTFYGEEVRICGNCPELGNWNPQKGYKLKTDTSMYPQWKTQNPIIINKNTKVMNNKAKSSKIQFKICIITSDGKYKWQTNVANRIISLENPAILQITFDQPKMITIIKKVLDIQCRQGTIDFINDYDSSQTSSIEFKQNYPIQRFFHQPNSSRKILQRKFSDSDLSSNLISLAEDNKDQQFFEIKVSNPNLPFNTPNLIKLQTCQMFSFQTQKTLSRRFDIYDHNHHSKSKQRSTQRSLSKNKRNISPIPYQINVPNNSKQNLKVYNKDQSPIYQKKISTQVDKNKQDQTSTQEISEQVLSISTQRQCSKEQDQILQRQEDLLIQYQYRKLGEI